MKVKSQLVINSEEVIKKFNLAVTTDNLDSRSAYGPVYDRFIRITILYPSNQVVFSDINSGERIIKTWE